MLFKKCVMKKRLRFVVSRFRNVHTLRTLLSLAHSYFASNKRHNINTYAHKDVLIWNDMEGHFKVFSNLVNLVKEPQKNNLAIRFLLLKFFFFFTTEGQDKLCEKSFKWRPSIKDCLSKQMCLSTEFEVKTRTLPPPPNEKEEE